MGPAAYQNPTITISESIGNVTDSHKGAWNNYNISIWGEKL